MKFRLDLTPQTASSRYDVIVVGGGPAGLSAALYLARFGVKSAIITDGVGGALTEAGVIDDYLGIPDVMGPELARRFEEHVRKYSVPIILARVDDVVREEESFKVKTGGMTYECRAVIIAVGSRRKELGVPGEREFRGRGVSYCAPCDAPLFKDKRVAVIGGGNAALQAALLLATYSPRVYLIHRRREFRAFKAYVDLINRNEKVVPILKSIVTEIGGGKSVEWVKVKDVETGEERMVRVDGVIIEIGSGPPKEFFKKIGLKTDDRGYVVVGPGQETNVEGMYAAGDCTAGPHKKKFDQVITAAAEGAVAALSAYEYLLRRGATG